VECFVALVRRQVEQRLLGELSAVDVLVVVVHVLQGVAEAGAHVVEKRDADGMAEGLAEAHIFEKADLEGAHPEADACVYTAGG
jgi:hypothetical protein